MHFRRHIRFYTAGAIGVATFAASTGHAYAFRFALAGDVFSASYLTMMAIYAAKLTPGRLRRRGEDGDEGLAVIFALALLVLSVSVGSIFVILNRPGENGLLPALLAVASVPLGWAMLHTVAAFHYATMFYTRAAPGDPPRTRAGWSSREPPRPASPNFSTSPSCSAWRRRCRTSSSARPGCAARC